MGLRALAERLIPSGSVTERAIQSGAWASVLTVTDRTVRLALYAVLANLLDPSAFGLLGLAALALLVLRRATRMGLSEALVQRDAAPAYLDTAWSLAVVRGCAIAVVAVLAAPAVARFFDAPRLLPVLRVLALAPLVEGLRNPGVAYLEKDLAFHRRFVFVTSGTGAHALAGISAALAGFGVWALVAATVARAAATTVTSYLVHPHRPGLRFDATIARDLLAFGKWLFASGIVLVALNRGDDAFVGWAIGPAALGLYQVAFRFSNAPATEVSHVVSRVAFPAFTAADDVEALRSGFLRTFRLVAVVALPMAAGIALVAPAFVAAVLGPQWRPAVPTMRVLAAWGLLRALVALCGPLFKALDHPEYSTAMQVIRLALLAILLPLGVSRLGLVGAALAVLGSALLQIPVAFWLAARELDAEGSAMLKLLVVPGAATLVMAGVVLAVAHGLALYAPAVQFVAMVATGVAIYAGAVLAANRVAGGDLWRDLETVRRAFG